MMAFEAPRRHVEKIFIHCSASDNAALTGQTLLEEVRRWHLARGFADVGYHFLIDKSGVVLPGRDPEKTPASQKGHNRGSVAVMVHGLEDFPAAMLEACRELCSAINESLAGRVSFHGHHEVAPYKACPVFDYRTVLRLDRFGRMP
jgi:hypothetical protein